MGRREWEQAHTQAYVNSALALDGGVTLLPLLTSDFWSLLSILNSRERNIFIFKNCFASSLLSVTPGNFTPPSCLSVSLKFGSLLPFGTALIQISPKPRQSPRR